MTKIDNQEASMDLSHYRTYRIRQVYITCTDITYCVWTRAVAWEKFQGAQKPKAAKLGAQHVNLCPEMHLTLNLGTSYKTGLFVVFIKKLLWLRDWQNYVCFSENKVRGHLVMSIIQFMNLIGMHFCTCLNMWSIRYCCKKFRHPEHFLGRPRPPGFY